MCSSKDVKGNYISPIAIHVSFSSLLRFLETLLFITPYLIKRARTCAYLLPYLFCLLGSPSMSWSSLDTRTPWYKHFLSKYRSVLNVTFILECFFYWQCCVTAAEQKLAVLTVLHLNLVLTQRKMQQVDNRIGRGIVCNLRNEKHFLFPWFFCIVFSFATPRVRETAEFWHDL